VTTAETTATSGGVLGLVVVILLQQLGVLPLSQLVPTVVAALIAVALGALLFGLVGWYADQR